MNGNITNVGTAVQLFNNPEFGSIRILIIEDEPWFVGKDVAVALGYSVARKAIYDHVDDEDKRGFQIGTPSGQQEMTIINESGLYGLILSSKLESAKRFKRWVTNEVLPSIRKTGSYGIGEGVNKTITPEDFSVLTANMSKLDDKIDVVLSLLKALQPGSYTPRKTYAKTHSSPLTQSTAGSEGTSQWRKEMHRLATAVAAHQEIKVPDVYASIYDILWRDYTWSRRDEKKRYAAEHGVDDLRTINNLDVIEDSPMYKSIFDSLMRDLYANSTGQKVSYPKMEALCAPPNHLDSGHQHPLPYIEAEAIEVKEAIERTETAGHIQVAENVYTVEQALIDLEKAREKVKPVVAMSYHSNVLSGMVAPLAKIVGDVSDKKVKTYRLIYKRYGKAEIDALTRSFRRKFKRNPHCTTEVFYRSTSGLDSFKETVRALIVEYNSN